MDYNQMELNPVNSSKLINKMAKSHIQKRTLQSTAVSFTAGLPGGLAMAETIPAGELTLFLGVMFGVGGSASALKIVSARVSNQVLKKLPQQALTKTIMYPIIKKIAKTIGINITKKTFAQGISKVIPIIGGVISGGLTYASMKPMGNRLRETLDDATHNYTTEDFYKDFDEVKEEVVDFKIIDAEFTEIYNEPSNNGDVRNDNNQFSVADELLKFKQLLDMGVLSQEEFDMKKAQLLNP